MFTAALPHFSKMNPDLVDLVAAFVNDRRIRDYLGFSVDSCIALRVPPCHLRVDAPLRERLEILCAARLSKKPLVVFDAESKVAVSIKFWWRFGRLTFKISRQATLFCLQRTYYTYIYTGEHNMVFHDSYAEWPPCTYVK